MKRGETNSSCSHPIDKFDQIGNISSLGKICLLLLHTILNDPKTNLLSLLALVTSIIPFLKINDIFCLIIFKQNFPYSSVLKTKVFHSGVCLFFTSLTIVLLIIDIVILKILDNCFRSYFCSHFYSSF